MDTSRFLAALSLLLMLGASPRAHARLVGEPDLRQLTQAANTIVVAEVLADESLGPTTLHDRSGYPSAGEQHLASLRIDEVLVGVSVPTTLAVSYANHPGWDNVHIGVQTPHFHTGNTELIFLNCGPPSACTLVSSEVSSVPVTRVPYPVPVTPPDGSLYLRVLQRIASGLFEPQASIAPSPNASAVDPRRSCLHLLDQQKGTPYINTLLHAALDHAPLSEELRADVLADVLRGGDLSVLPAVADTLGHLDHATPNRSYEGLLSALSDVPWTRALPLIPPALRSASPEIRRGAIALLPTLVLRDATDRRKDYAASATHMLLPLLRDSDPDVVFNTMLALSDLNGHADQRPSQSYSPPIPCPTCLQFWLNFPDPTPNQP